MAMDAIFKNMDFLIKHWAPFPRRFPFRFPVNSSNFVTKKDWVRWAFESCNFSLILRGRGEFHCRGKVWPVEAPCVLTQVPGEFVEYGPPASETWDELYIIYDAKLVTQFKACGFVDARRPMWPITNLPAVMALAYELESLAGAAVPEAVVDRVDRVCERLVLESSLPLDDTDDGRETMRAVLAEVRRKISGPVDFDEIARRNGMSTPTFRRRWAEVADMPPQRYLQQLRLREACRLLAETTQPVKTIAHKVGFEDEFYFSRRFQAEMQMSPRDYRRAHRIRNGVKQER